jgi:hypothetical protein
MLSMRNFNENTFIELNPDVVRTKVRVSQPFALNIESTQLRVELKTSKGMRPYSFPLQLLAKNEIEGDDGLFSSTPASTEYTLSLSDKAIENVREVQTSLSNEEIEEGGFSVNVSFDNPDENTNHIGELRMSIFLKLYQDKDYLTLIDDASIEVKPDTKE